MADVTTIEATKREGAGKGPARAARRAGLVAAMIYGNNLDAVMINLERRYLDQRFKKRAAIQKQIQELSRERAAFVATEMQKRNLDANKAFDVAVRKAIRKQAETKGFQW